MHFGVRDWILSVGASDGNLARGLSIMTYTSTFHFRTAAGTVEGGFGGSQERLKHNRLKGVLKAVTDDGVLKAYAGRNGNRGVREGENSRR